MPGESQNRNNGSRESVGMTGSYSARRANAPQPEKQIQLIDVSHNNLRTSMPQNSPARNQQTRGSGNRPTSNRQGGRGSNSSRERGQSRSNPSAGSRRGSSNNRTGANHHNPLLNRDARMANRKNDRNRGSEPNRSLPPFNRPIMPIPPVQNRNRRDRSKDIFAQNEELEEEEQETFRRSRPDFLGLRNKRGKAGAKKGSLTAELSGSIKKVAIILAPIILMIMVIMSVCMVVLADENEFTPLFGVNSKTGGDTGGIEYTDSPADEEAFFERVKKVSDEYKANGKTFDPELIGAAYFIIQNYNEEITMDSMTEDDIRIIVNAMFDGEEGTIYSKDTFIKNLVSDVFPRFIPGLDEEFYKEIADEMFDYVEAYKELIEAQDKVPSTGGTVGGNILYWWPIGSAEVTEENGVTFAKGNPTSTEITSEFSNRIDPINGQQSTHTGLDLVGANGNAGVENVIAALDGVVVYPTSKTVSVCPSFSDGGCGGGYGNYVVIQHSDGNFTLYAHMHPNTVTVQAGDTVKQGQVIGKMGSSGRSTGTHLHFEVRKGANLQSSVVNPLDYIDPNNPRPMSTGSSGFSLEQSSLTKAEFVAKMNDYCSRSGDSNFCTNFAPHAESIYDTAHAAGVNPELVVVTAGKEQGWGLGCGYNFYGIGIPNGAGCSAGPQYASLEDGIRGYGETLAAYRPGGEKASMIEQRYQEREAAGCDPAGHGMPGTLQGMQSVYSWIGDYRYNPGSWGSGGCVYLTIIYGDSYPYCKPETAAVDNVTPTTVCEQNDYTAWQLQGKFELRQQIFGL